MKKILILLIMSCLGFSETSNRIFSTFALKKGNTLSIYAKSTNTVLLIQSETTNGSTTFVDATGKSLSNLGTAAHSTAQSKFGSSSIGLGSSGGIGIATNSDFAMGTGDFTVDFWVYFKSLSYQWFIFSCNDNFSDNFFSFNLESSSKIATHLGPTNEYKTFTWDPVVNTWYHLAFTRSSSNLRFFANGSQVGTTQTSIANITAPLLSVGCRLFITNVYEPLDGYLEEVRITKGLARWTNNFTPPSAPDSLD